MKHLSYRWMSEWISEWMGKDQPTSPSRLCLGRNAEIAGSINRGIFNLRIHFGTVLSLPKCWHLIKEQNENHWFCGLDRDVRVTYYLRVHLSAVHSESSEGRDTILLIPLHSDGNLDTAVGPPWVCSPDLPFISRMTLDYLSLPDFPFQ